MDFNIGIDILEMRELTKNKKYIIDNLLSPKEQTALKAKEIAMIFYVGVGLLKKLFIKP